LVLENSLLGQLKNNVSGTLSPRNFVGSRLVSFLEVVNYPLSDESINRASIVCRVSFLWQLFGICVHMDTVPKVVHVTASFVFAVGR